MTRVLYGRVNIPPKLGRATKRRLITQPHKQDTQQLEASPLRVQHGIHGMQEWTYNGGHSQEMLVMQHGGIGLDNEDGGLLHARVRVE